jgi:glycerophosphoryl diester phosphodiesterase
MQPDCETSRKTALRAEFAWIAERPIAHRGLHNSGKGIHENTLSATRAAMQRGYAIEADLQPSADGVPMVFHDYELSRLTGVVGKIVECAAAELKGMAIAGSRDTIPTLEKLLDMIDGRAGLVLELKEQEQANQEFAEAVARSVASYRGPLALMSFSHSLIDKLYELEPPAALGLTAQGDDSLFAVHSSLVKRVPLDFLSYHLPDLNCRVVADFRKAGRPVISWTVRSPEQAELSAQYADQITFEGFLPTTNRAERRL